MEQETRPLPRLLVGALASGSGKTTLVCGLLRALQRRGLAPTAFKCGPDYIDPLFHREVVGAPSRSLELFFTGAQGAREALARHGGSLAILEGVMGLYDGWGPTDQGSSWQVARETATPVVLAVDCRGGALTLAAQLRGIRDFRPGAVQALVLNRCRPDRYPAMKELLEREVGLPVLGYLPPLPQYTLESRHLGLVTAAEVADLGDKLEGLTQAVAATVEVDALLALAATAPPVEALPPPEKGRGEREKPPAAVSIAIAKDKAFCFYYAENLELLESLGARLLPFSPLTDTALPAGAQGLLLGGGYPELVAGELAQNAAMRESIRRAVEAGMPTIAECGGFLYLQQSLEGVDGKIYPMVGALEGHGARTPRLRRFGLCTLTARQDSLLCRAGESLPAHEFHYWDSDKPGMLFEAAKPAAPGRWTCGQGGASLYAGFPHLWLGANPQAARRFVESCMAWKGRKGDTP